LINLCIMAGGSVRSVSWLFNRQRLMFHLCIAAAAGVGCNLLLTISTNNILHRHTRTKRCNLWQHGMWTKDFLTSCHRFRLKSRTIHFDCFDIVSCTQTITLMPSVIAERSKRMWTDYVYVLMHAHFNLHCKHGLWAGVRLIICRLVLRLGGVDYITNYKLQC